MPLSGRSVLCHDNCRRGGGGRGRGRDNKRQEKNLSHASLDEEMDSYLAARE